MTMCQIDRKMIHVPNGTTRFWSLFMLITVKL
jgi:hypothetical protein